MLGSYGFIGLAMLVAVAQLPRQATAQVEGPAAIGQPATGRVGRLVKVTAPISGPLEQRIQKTVDRLLKEARDGEQPPVLVLEIHPGRSDYGKALDLARYLSTGKALDVHKVAFVPESLNGHAVLVAMACNEIMMHSDATIGEAGIHEEEVGPDIRSGYVTIANNSRTIPVDLAIGMLDKNVEVLEVETEVSREIVLAERLDEIRAQRAIVKSTVLIKAGEFGNFSATEASRLDLISRIADDRQEVARALGLSSSMLEEDPSLTGAWRAVRIDVKGPINAAMIEQLQRLVGERINKQQANFVFVWIDSPGGAPTQSSKLATYLAGLNPGTVRSVAYIDRQARADAAFIALACDHIVMLPDAVVGGSGAYQIPSDEIDAYATAVADIAREKYRSPSLSAAMVDPKRKVYKYHRKSDGTVDYFSEEDHAQLPDSVEWEKVDQRPINGGNEPLLLTGSEAEEYGIARAVVDDLTGLRQLYGLEEDPALVEPGWADYLITAISSPQVAWLLFLIGGAAIYVELQAPGIGIGGFVAGVCFLLYFWSSYMGGTAGWLEILLFLAGVACVALEIFVLPGFGVFGLGGGTLIIASLVLASQTFILPRNAYQTGQMTNTLVALLALGGGFFAMALFARRYLPHTPGLSQVLLAPLEGAELEELSRRESFGMYDHLINRRGKTATQLTPGGKAIFDDRLLDVMSEGEVIPVKTDVVVVEVRGHRVVVRAAT